MQAFDRIDTTFDSHGWRCAAWVYEPEGEGPHPCVVMAHGWSGVREQRLDAYAERFAAAGIGSVVFDYRHFGASQGQPRQLLDITKQLEDWTAGIAFARSRPSVDPERVALWGSSFSGGHVQRLAARDHRVAAVVAQVPFADGLRNLPRLGLRVALGMSARGLRDQLGALLGRPPLMLPSVGPPGSLAVMTSPDAEPGFRALDPPISTWRNETAARIALHVGSYRPGRDAGDIACPILYLIAEDDQATPPAFAEAAAARAPRSEVKHYPGGHFDIYTGAAFERTIADQVEFLQRHLLGGERPVPVGSLAVSQGD